MKHWRLGFSRGSFLGAASIAALSCAALAACGDGEGSGSAGSSSSSGSSGSSSSSGGSAAGCIEPAVFADAFAIAEGAGLCAVAIYEAAIDPVTFSAPTWGSHGGPLTILQGAAAGSVKLTRWQLPAEPTGTLTEQSQELSVNIPADAYLGAQALDLPFFGWTAFSWTPAFPAIGGEVVFLSGGQVAKRYKTNSAYAIAALGDANQGRFLHTALSPLEDAAGMSSALHGADSCGSTAAQDARLLPEGDGSCGAPLAVSAWGEASGPITVDRAGNVFAAMSSYSTNDQELRGFEASLMGRGKAANEGQSVAKLPGYGSALAAIAPTANADGWLLFQPATVAMGPQNIVGFAYKTSASKVVLGQTQNDMLVLAKPGTAFSLMNDDQDRVWVGAPADKTTRFIVLARVSTP